MLNKENLKDIYPLSPMQAGFLYHHLYDEDSSAYLNQYSFRISGDMEPQDFAKALAKTIAHHDTLRTVFVYKNVPEPLQIVLKQQQSEFSFADLRELELADDAAIKQFIDDFKADDLARSFDLDTGPLVRINLLQIAERQFEFIWTNHHIVIDGWGSGIILKDLFTVYYALQQGIAPQLSPVTPYKVYLDWLQNQDTGKAQNYWRQYLKGYEQTASLQPVNSNPHRDDFSLKTLDVVFSSEISLGLQAVAKRFQVTVSVVVQTLWALVLGQYSGQNDVVFGLVVSGRPEAVDGIENMTGMCMNTIPVRISWAAGESLGDLLKTVQTEALSSEAFHYYPLVEIQSETTLKQRLFDYLIDFENYPLDDELQTTFKAFTQGAGIDSVEEVDHSHYDFTMIVRPHERMSFLFMYNTAVFDDRFIRDLAQYFETVAGQSVSDPGSAISQLASKSAELPFAAFNPQVLEYPEDKTIVDVFEAQVERTPDHAAVVCEGRTLSYQELNTAANQVAHALRDQFEFEPDDRVAIVMARSEWMLVGIWGILKAGAAYVPMEPDYPDERIRHITQHGNCRLVLTDAILQSHLTEMGLDTPLLDIQKAKGGEGNLALPLDSAQMAYIIYTSGSTGEPKGVVIEHGSLVSLVHALEPVIYEHLPNPLNEAMASAFVFDLSVKQLFSTLVRGNTLHVLTGDVRLDASLFSEYVNEHSIHLIDISPSFFTAMLEAGFADQLPTQLRHIIVGSESVPPALIERFYRYPSTQHITMTDMYGPTENCAEATYYPLDASFRNQGLAAVPIGRPIPNTEILLLNKQLEAVPMGVVGELCLSSPGVARGYLGDEKLTEEKFLSHPFQQGKRIYRSGDLARWNSEGQLEYLGRNDDQVKIRGFRIELGEVEKWLREYPGVSEAVVLVKEVQDNRELVAYVVGKASERQLSVHMKNTAPHYMVPSYIVLLDQLPLNVSSKVDKKALAEIPLENIIVHDALDGDYAGPRNELETGLQGVWEAVLGKSGIGVHDDFFELGGHSIKATQLIAKIHKQLKINIKLRDLFLSPTIAGLSERILEQEQVLQNAIVSVADAEDYEVSYAQRRLWLMDQLGLGDMTYGIHDAVRLEGVLNVEALRSSFETLCHRHESLRTVIVSVNGEPRQRILPASSYHLEVLEGLGNGSELLAHEAAYKFNLETGPLLRTCLIQHSDQCYTLAFTIHHIISDGWSLDVFLKELAILYNTYNGYKVAELTPLPIQYKDYAAWQNKLLDGAASTSLRHYWNRKLQLPLPVLNLKTDHVRPAMKTYGSNVVKHEIDAELTNKLRQFSHTHNVTLFMVLVTAVRILLYRQTGQTDTIIGTALSGRNHPDLEQQIGFYVNLLPLRTSVSDSSSFQQALQSEKETVLGAYDHQAYPFDRLVEDCAAQNDRSRFPLFDVVVDLQDDEQFSEGLFYRLDAKLAGYEPDTSEYDIAWLCTDKGDSLSLGLTYNCQLFNASTMKQWINHLECIFSAVTQNVNILPGDIPIHEHSIQQVDESILSTTFDF